MKLFRTCAFMMFLYPGLVHAGAVEKIVVVSWGGTYEAAQRAAFFKPFTSITGIDIQVAKYGGGLSELRKGSVSWDVIDMTEADAIAACEEGLIERLDPFAILTPSQGGTLAKDFLPGAFKPCSIAQVVYSTVIAFDERAFPGEKPSRVADFFDLDRFPGKRAIQRDPSAILEWALIAEGVPIRQIYDLLSTDRGMRVAFRKLETIRSHIVWWKDPAEPATLLRDRKVAMASGYNGRFFSVANNDGAPVTTIWDAQILDYDVWAIPITSKRKQAAKDFIGFATSVDRLAALSEYIPYGPTRLSALSRVGRHGHSQVDMRFHLPNSPRNNKRSLRRDSRWYARTENLRKNRFEAWLSSPEAPEE